MTVAIRVGPICARPAALAGHRGDEARLHQHAVVGDGRRDQRHLERRDERLGLAVRGVRELDVVGEAARRAAAPVVDLRDGRRQVERDRPAEAHAVRVRRRGSSPPVRRPASAYQMLHETSVAPTRSSAARPGRRVMAVLDPEPVDEQAGLLGRRLLRERRRRLDRPGAEAGDRGDDLEHGARHVPALRRPRQERLRRVVAEPREGRLRRRRVRDGRRVVGRRRRQREDLAGPRIEHHDGAAVRAERRGPPPAGGRGTATGSGPAGRTGRA